MGYDALVMRMKEYEAATDTKLVNRMPVIIRLDGRAFHTFTKGFEKPFDNRLNRAMQETMQYLCENITNCIFGYTQSDEITLVLFEQSKEAQPWFDNRIQKIVSSAASMATLKFNECLGNYWLEAEEECWHEDYKFLTGKQFRATFDARAFNLPKEEVVNNIIWRQQDAIRNSINSLAQANFSHKQLQGKNMTETVDFMIDNGINWNNLPIKYKHGSACIRKPAEVDTPNGKVIRNKWFIDNEMPVININKDYVEKLFEEGN